MRIAFLLVVVCAVAPAATWTGPLVDAKCYASEQRNRNPDDTQDTVDRDMNYQVRYCAPRKKTRDFAVILPDWQALRLDPAGNAKAADLVRTTAPSKVSAVSVIGQLTKDTIAVESISAAR
jgi:hypothetical protein